MLNVSRGAGCCCYFPADAAAVLPPPEQARTPYPPVVCSRVSVNVSVPEIVTSSPQLLSP